MSVPLPDALERVRAALVDTDTLVKAVLSGRRRGEQPPWRRVELRWVDLKSGRHLQLVAYDETQAHTSNHAIGDHAAAAVPSTLA